MMLRKFTKLGLKIKWSGSKESNLYSKGFYASICKVITCITSFVLFTFIVLYQMKVLYFDTEDSEFTKILHRNCSHCPESWMFPPRDVLCKTNENPCHLISDEMANPVCGSDGITYPSICHFNWYKRYCKSEDELKIGRSFIKEASSNAELSTNEKHRNLTVIKFAEC